MGWDSTSKLGMGRYLQGDTKFLEFEIKNDRYGFGFKPIITNSNEVNAISTNNNEHNIPCIDKPISGVGVVSDGNMVTLTLEEESKIEKRRNSKFSSTNENGNVMEGHMQHRDKQNDAVDEDVDAGTRDQESGGKSVNPCESVRTFVNTGQSNKVLVIDDSGDNIVLLKLDVNTQIVSSNSYSNDINNVLDKKDPSMKSTQGIVSSGDQKSNQLLIKNFHDNSLESNKIKCCNSSTVPPTLCNDILVDTVFPEFDSQFDVADSFLPEVQFSIKGLHIKGLIDTGAEMSCMSINFWNGLIDRGDTFLTLPISNIQIKCATGSKSQKINTQALIPLEYEGKVLHVNVLIVRDLVRELILGTDFLKIYHAEISFVNFTLDVSLGGERVQSHFIVLPTESTEIPFDINYVKINHEDWESVEDLKSKVEETSLRGDQKSILLSLLIEYNDIFAKRPGRTDCYEHKILLHDKIPFIKRPYPIPLALREPLREHLEEMLDMGVISQEPSNYSSPFTVARKKDGSIRFCVDARTLNDKMVADTEGPPPVDELIQKFDSVKFITSLDLKSGYWQVPLENSSRKCTAFLFDGKSYVYNVLPFGLKTAVASFSRCLDIVLGPEICSKITKYIDDILLTDTTFEKHIENLREIFLKFRQAKMTLNLKKSTFIKQEVKFLGHILTTEGIYPDPDKVAAIKDFPVPKRAKDIKAFLGLCNFYRKFYKEFSNKSYLLNALLRKGVRWKWGKEESRAFEGLKSLFLQRVMLSYPKMNKIFRLQTDSSDYALGVMCFQILDDDSIGVIGFASRSLRGAELNYTTTEKELLAIIFGLNKFMTFLYGRHFIIQTDHEALTFLKQSKLLNARLTRWVLFLQRFDFEILHIKGCENVVADTLSRFPTDGGEGGINHNEPLITPLLNFFEVEDLKNIKGKIANIGYEQCKDLFLREIISYLNSGLTQNKEVLRVAKFYFIKNYILFHKNPFNMKVTIVLPASLIFDVVEFYHIECGHLGIAKITDIIRGYFYWRRLHKSIKLIVRSCDVCQRSKARNFCTTGKFIPILPNNIGDLVSVDFYGPLPKSYGCQYIFVVMDVFSKLVQIYPLKKATASAALFKLRNCFFKIIKPKCVLSDNGTQYSAKIWYNTLNKLGIKTTHITVRHPPSSPVERVMRSLNSFFRAFCAECHLDWVNIVKDIENCLNNTTHSSTGYAPWALVDPKNLLVGEISKLVVDLLPNKDSSKEDKIILARFNLIKAAEDRAKQQKVISKLKYVAGDLVLVRANYRNYLSKTTSGKFFPLYEGPFEIVMVFNNTVLLKNCETDEIKGKVNVENIKKYYKRLK